MTVKALKTAGVGLLLGLIAGWLIALRPALAERDRLAESRAPLAQRLDAEQRRLADRKAVTAAIERRRSALRHHPMRLPAAADESRLVSHLAGLAADNGARLVDIDPGTTRATPAYHQRRLVVRLNGGWTPLMRFLAGVEQTTRGIALTGLEFNDGDADAQPGGIVLTLNLDVYWQPSVPGASQPAETSAGWIAETRRPDAVPPGRPPANPFASASPSMPIADTDIRYIGRIIRGDRQWALIRRADGPLQRHQRGDPIAGLGQLARIQSGAISVAPGPSNPDAPMRIIPRQPGPPSAGE
ncbi:type 4a pilus biogenesis protein PilO [Spiribacter roseus]|uniref:type 4a pilus biogenesis protein PilO n=1 Tax=Spiribacter roseus TaxID=1855875 RepID=UPI001330BBF6|nr:type 4a pilus biogenesis protein PilO [Spiribacter roseus]